MAHYLERWTKKQLVSTSVVVETDHNTLERLSPVDVLIIRTDFKIGMVVWHAEGLKGAFAVKGMMLFDHIMSVVKREVQKAYTLEEKDWQERYGRGG